MNRLLAVLLALMIATSTCGQAPPAPVPVPVKPVGPVVVFPALPVPIPPVPPQPVPGQAVLLAADQLYVVQASAPVVVLASPQGVVKVTPQTGPITIWGRFIDGTAREVRTFKGPNVYVVEVSGSGTCELITVSALDLKSVDRRTLTTDVKPPEPPPDPKPPGPTPSPAPIPADGFRALIVYESADLNKLPQGQIDILYGSSVRSYMTSKAVMGPDGRTKEWRILSKEEKGDSKIWQDAMARPRKELPWLILSDGKKGFEGPLPKTEAEMLTLLKSIGG